MKPNRSRVQHVYHHEVKAPVEPLQPQISVKVDVQNRLEVSVWNCATPDQAAALLRDAYLTARATLNEAGIKPTASKKESGKDA